MITECAYCDALGNWAKTLAIGEGDRKSRERNGLIELNEPMYLCDYCYNCAFRVTSTLIYNNPQQPATVADLERALARYLNFHDGRRR